MGWRWGDSVHALRHISRLICGKALPAWSDGMIERLRSRHGGRLPFARACSIGCGDAAKEIELVQAGIVEHFHLFELSEERARHGMYLARQAGLAERIHYTVGDAFAREHVPYDFFLWNNALHHMPDSRAALAFTRAHLAPGGVLCLQDYTGPTRFQWPESMLAAINAVRRFIGGEPVLLPPISLIEASDPSEAIDSGAILPALADLFPQAETRPLGGVVYFVALAGARADIPHAALRRLLPLDKQLSDNGMSLFTFVLA
jgi:SAM-dependent methyltransferase